MDEFAKAKIGYAWVPNLGTAMVYSERKLTEICRQQNIADDEIPDWLSSHELFQTSDNILLRDR